MSTATTEKPKAKSKPNRPPKPDNTLTLEEAWATMPEGESKDKFNLARHLIRNKLGKVVYWITVTPTGIPVLDNEARVKDRDHYKPMSVWAHDGGDAINQYIKAYKIPFELTHQFRFRTDKAEA